MSNGYGLFGTPFNELQMFFAPPASPRFEDDSIIIEGYTFENSIISRQSVISPEQITDFCLQATPPQIRIGNELIFVTAVEKDNLAKYARKYNIKLVDRMNLWDFILEPFLDTEFSPEDQERTFNLLARYGLERELVESIRKQVEVQMMKYNFDTMLWEWVSFGPMDVLMAMRPKLSKADFANFYNRVMEIALLPAIQAP